MSAGQRVDRQKSLERYFWSPPRFPKVAPLNLILLLLLALYLLSALSDLLGAMGFLLGVLCLPVVAVVVIGVFDPDLADRLLRSILAPRDRPSDTEVDTWIDQSITRVVDRSRVLLALTEAEEIAFPAINVENLFGAVEAHGYAVLRERSGLDGRVRGYRINVRVFWVTTRRIASFEASLDLIQDSILDESVREYPLSEVAGVDLLPESSLAQGGQLVEVSRLLRLHLRSGQCEAIRLLPQALGHDESSDSAIVHLLRFAMQSSVRSTK